jgi:tetratricopeptide (TPR) repeat protein
MAADLYEQGDLEEARSIFELLVEAFEDYAEGYNYLGLIALRLDRLDEAIAHFAKTIEVGRTKFPRRIPKQDWWSRIETRPYMRGLRNQCLALLRAGRHDESLALCDRLERECDDAITAQAHRSSIFLNTGRWEEALAAADWIRRLDPGASLIGALAAFELGRRDEATSRLLHAALNQPRMVRMVLGLRTPALRRPSRGEAEDHNAGVDALKDLAGYLGTRRPAMTRFFRALLRRPEVEELLAELERAIERWRGPHEPHAEWRAAFDRMQLMRTADFARDQAKAIAGHENAPRCR